MQRLRDSDTGCPWDKQQTLASLIPYSIEEVYELVDAIENQDIDEIKNELGDLLFHIVFYAHIAQENDWFDFSEIAQAVCKKLIRRHPHVFSDAISDSVEEVNSNWERIKTQERLEKGLDSNSTSSLLDGIASALPAMIRAEKIQRRVSTIGFDWHNINELTAKVKEELDEVNEVLLNLTENDVSTSLELEEELGDLLFSCVNLVRFSGRSAEAVLRAGNAKFSKRFKLLEESVSQSGRIPDDLSVQELNDIWDEVKNLEKDPI